MIFFWQAKKKAIKKFATQLPEDLHAEFGSKRKYTPDEIESVFKKYNYKDERKYWCYGYALYGDRLDFNTYHVERGEVCDFDAMRGEIMNVVLATGIFGGGIAAEFSGSESSGSSDGGGDVNGGPD